LANHTYAHGLGSDLFHQQRLTDDLRRCQDSLAAVLGAPPKYYRPTVGVRNPVVHAAARELGLTVVTWTHAARDGLWSLTERRARALGRAGRAGDILTLHDGLVSAPAHRREATAAHLPSLLDELCDQGFSRVTLDELLAGSPPAEPPRSGPPRGAAL
jgi:peptidoglycan/xylan/chitin deacetylase (PgdA/CDA1 family)